VIPSPRIPSSCEVYAVTVIVITVVTTITVFTAVQHLLTNRASRPQLCLRYGSTRHTLRPVHRPPNEVRGVKGAQIKLNCTHSPIDHFVPQLFSTSLAITVITTMALLTCVALRCDRGAAPGHPSSITDT
jgi:hypothetical protein